MTILVGREQKLTGPKVNNAGGGTAQGISLLDLSAADVQRGFAVNTYSTLYAVQAVAPHMPRGGRIVNIGSVVSRVRNAPGLAVYGASKAAQEYLTGAMSYEVSFLTAFLPCLRTRTTLTRSV